MPSKNTSDKARFGVRNPKKVKGQVKYMIKTILFSVAALFFVSGIVFITKDIKEKWGQ